MYNSDTVYSTTVFRPVSLSPSIFPDIETPPPQRTRKLETPLHFDGGLFSDIRSSDGKLLSKVTVDRMHSSTRRDVVDTPHVSESSDARGNKDYVDDIVKTETITNEDVFKVKFTPVSFELDGLQKPAKLSLERPRTPVIRPTVIDRAITPPNVAMTLIDRPITPISRPITPFDRPVTPMDHQKIPIVRSITHMDRPITPINVPMAIFDRPKTPVKIISEDYEDLQSYKIIKTLLKEHSDAKADNLNYWDDKMNFIGVNYDEPVKRAPSPLANFIVSEQLTKIDSYLQKSLNVCSENSIEINSKLHKRNEERGIGVTHDTNTTKINEDTICSNKDENNITSQNSNKKGKNSSNNVMESTVKCNAIEEIQPTSLKEVNSVKAKHPGVVNTICNMPMHYHAAILCFFLIVYNLIYQYVKQNHHGIKK